MKIVLKKNSRQLSLNWPKNIILTVVKKLTQQNFIMCVHIPTLCCWENVKFDSLFLQIENAYRKLQEKFSIELEKSSLTTNVEDTKNNGSFTDLR